MSRRLRAVVGGSCLVGSMLVLGAMPAGAQAGEADLVAGTPSVSPAASAGGTSTYAIGITNGGPDATTNVRIQTNFNLSGDDAALTIGGASVTGGTCSIAGPRVVVCNVPALGVGETAGVAITFSLATTATGTITVNGRITSDLLDPDPDNFSSTGPLAITPPPTTAPPTTAAPPTAPPVTEAPQPARPQPSAAPVPQATTPARAVTPVQEVTPTQLPSTGTPSRLAIGLGAAGLLLGGALVLVGRRRDASA